jgi:hypothetical protein
LNIKKILLSASLLIYYNVTLNAAEVQKRDRLHSVKEAMGQVTNMKDKEISVVDNFKHMFEAAKVSGQIRIMYAGYKQDNTLLNDTYASAVGGILKYELAAYNGFNAGVAVYTSHDIPFASGSGIKHNSELSSSKGEYTTVGEAYINYNYKALNLRAGRQRLDTPLADSDDIRMIPNSFEAYVAKYELNGFDFMAGHINSWQGVDADLDKGWSATATDGVNFSGVSYSDDYELDLWYYNITDATNAVYFDTGINYELSQTLSFHAMVQFLKEDELSKSGYDADIYGGMLELVIGGLGVNFAYDTTDTSNKKQIFSGTGGGTLYTGLDTMTLDVIAVDRRAQAFVSGISYNYDNLNFLYAYGAFLGDKDSNDVKAYIVEQNIGFEYNVNEEFIVSAIYVLEEDRHSRVKTENDWNRAQLMIHYNF